MFRQDRKAYNTVGQYVLPGKFYFHLIMLSQYINVTNDFRYSKNIRSAVLRKRDGIKKKSKHRFGISTKNESNQESTQLAN